MTTDHKIHAIKPTTHYVIECPAQGRIRLPGPPFSTHCPGCGERIETNQTVSDAEGSVQQMRALAVEERTISNNQGALKEALLWALRVDVLDDVLRCIGTKETEPENKGETITGWYRYRSRQPGAELDDKVLRIRVDPIAAGSQRYTTDAKWIGAGFVLQDDDGSWHGPVMDVSHWRICNAEDGIELAKQTDRDPEGSDQGHTEGEQQGGQTK